MNNIIRTINNSMQPTLKRITIDDLIDFFKQPPVKAQLLDEPNDTDAVKHNKYMKTTPVKNLPKNLTNIFNAFDIYSTGTVDISFFSSLLMLFFPKFNSMKENEKTDLINELIAKLQKSTKLYFDKFDYAKLFDINYSTFTSSVGSITQQNPLSNYVVCYISDFLFINIFLLDVETDSLYFCGHHFDRFKKNAFLLKLSDTYYEPITFKVHNEQTILWTNDDSDFIRHLIDCPFLVENITPKLTFKVELENAKKNEDTSEVCDKSSSITFLKNVAVQRGIDVTYVNKNGKKSYKTKPMLLKDLLQQ